MKELSKQIIEVLSNSSEKLNYKQIAAKMKIFDKKGREEVKKELEKLINAKVVLKAGRGKYKLNSKFQDTKTTGKHYIIGRVEQKHSGMAFVIPQGSRTTRLTNPPSMTSSWQTATSATPSTATS